MREARGLGTHLKRSFEHELQTYEYQSVKTKTLTITHFIPVYAPASFGGPVLSVGRLCEALAKLDTR